MDRRGFLNRMFGAAGAALGGAILYPVIRYMVPPRQPSTPPGRVLAAHVDELAVNAFKIFPYGSEPAILIRMADGRYRAFSAVCTHLGCTVRYRASGPDIWCPCHNGVYDLQGHNVSGPPPRPLEQYAVQVVGKDIFVEKTA